MIRCVRRTHVKDSFVRPAAVQATAAERPKWPNSCWEGIVPYDRSNPNLSFGHDESNGDSGATLAAHKCLSTARNNSVTRSRNLEWVLTKAPILQMRCSEVGLQRSALPLVC